MAEEKFKGILGYFLLRWRVSFLLMIGLALAGITTALTLPRESTPEVTIPFASVVTVYPGASARDVEELVTDAVETRVENVEGVKEVTSSSQLGVSVVSVEFNAEEDVDEAIGRLRESISSVPDIPSGAEDPEVVEISFENEPILIIALGGINDERLLTLYAETVAEEARAITGVSDVRVVGGREEEIQVLLDPERLAQYGLSISRVVAAIQGSNVNVPIGQIDTQGFTYDVRLQGRFSSIADVASVTVTNSNGVPIPLDELGTVQLVIPDSSTQARISVNGEESTPAVTLQVTKKTGGNIIDIVDSVEAVINDVREEQLPPEVFIETFADRAEDIRKSLRDVSSSGFQTLIIVFIVLWLFLGWKEALIAALAVPLTFSLSFILFDSAGITLNSLSLFSLILALGLLVDNAIVLVEGIHRGVGKPNLREHAYSMVQRFRKPLIGGTLTTVAAFAPMLLVSGIIGQFLRTIPIVLSATLLSSLIVALAFIPVVAVQTLKNTTKPTAPRRFDGYFTYFQNWYKKRIEYMLSHRRAQNIFITTLVVLLVAGFALPSTGVLRTGLFPSVDVNFMIVNVELPSGAVLEQTSQTMIEIENVLRNTPEIQSYVANIGTSSSIDIGGGSSSEHLGSFSINLREDRARTSVELTRDLRRELAEIGTADITVVDISAGPPTAAPVEFRVIGPDLDQLVVLSQQLMDELSQVPGTIDVDRNLRFSAGEFTFAFDPTLLAQYGLSASDAAFTLRNYVFGTEATSFLGDAGDEVPVQVEAPNVSVDSVNDILTLPLVNQQGEIVRVSQVGTVELNTSINTVRRTDGERAITVTANSDESRTPNEISLEFQEKVAAKQLPDGYRVEFGGEQQETAETFADLYRSMIVAVLLILIILVIEFDSFKQPVLIFLSIPLALIGVFFGLLILGGQLNFAAFIGLVSLTGIVVNNAIILVDRMNTLIDAGRTPIDAVLEAVNTRLRPVMLTTLTTTLGVLPLIWVDEFFRDLALTLITGLVFSTILTLVFIPVLYLRMKQKEERRAQAKAARV